MTGVTTGVAVGAPQLLTVHVERRGDAIRLAVGGELDLSTAKIFSAELAAVLRRPSVRRLVVDLSTLSFMSSTGIRLLLDVAERSVDHGYELAVVKGPPAVQRVLELTSVDTQLPLVDRPEDVGFATI